MPNCRPWYLSCCETSWWKDCVCLAFMSYEIHTTCGSWVSLPHMGPIKPNELPSTMPSTRQNNRSKTPVVVRHSAKLTIDYESCAWVISRQEHKPPKYSLMFIYSDIQKTKMMYFFGRYKDGEPLIISDRPWNYNLQQKFGLNTLEIRRWVTSSNL